jgi:hypothetical protein
MPEPYERLSSPGIQISHQLYLLLYLTVRALINTYSVYPKEPNLSLESKTIQDFCTALGNGYPLALAFDVGNSCWISPAIRNGFILVFIQINF